MRAPGRDGPSRARSPASASSAPSASASAPASSGGTSSPVSPVRDDLADAVHVRADDRQPRGHRLEHAARQALPDRRQDEDVGAREQRADVLGRTGAEEAHAVGEPELGRQRARRLEPRPVADELALEVGALVAQAAQRVEEDRMALALDETGDTDDLRARLCLVRRLRARRRSRRRSGSRGTSRPAARATARNSAAPREFAS